MANNIGWGQGASNNTIGWGQGAANNTISWGISQYLTQSIETNLYGSLNYLLQFVTDFQTRVNNDGGTLVNFDCLYSLLNGEITKGGILAKKFEQRVVSDGGSLDALQCLINTLNSL